MDQSQVFNIKLFPETSEKFDIILNQLMKVKNEMGSVVKKDSKNPFHKSTYASLGAHLDLAEPILFRHGLIMMHAPNILNDQHVLVASIYHPDSGQWVKSYLPLPNLKGDSQTIGASITYMRRYSINSMLGLNAEDDDGETAVGRGKNAERKKQEEVAKSNQKEEATAEHIEQFDTLLKVKGLNEKKVQQFLARVSSTYKESKGYIILKWLKDMDKFEANFAKWLEKN